MPTVAIIDGVKIQFYPDEHPPPHFHAVFAEFVAQIQIDPPVVLKGSLPPNKLEAITTWTLNNRDVFGEVEMSEIIRMRSVEPVLYGVVKITWLDGYEAIVDLRPVISEGQIFAFLRHTPERFDAVKLADFGHSIYWLDDEGEEIDFGSDSLRRRAERQAEILRLAS